MVKFFVIGGIAIVVIGIAVVFFFFFRPLPDVSKYEALKSPRIVLIPNMKMLEVSISGNPNKILPEAFSKLFSAYFSIKETAKGPDQSAPRLRVKFSEDMTAFENNVGEIAMQVGLAIPESVTALADSGSTDSGAPKIATWQYGDTAEILHAGPYDKETPTINALLEFVSAQGYEPAGIHEEEYIIGPGNFGISPDKYYTVIRYPVKKK
jgi:hypothetical protein